MDGHLGYSVSVCTVTFKDGTAPFPQREEHSGQPLGTSAGGFGATVVQQKPHDEAEETEGLSKDQDENHHHRAPMATLLFGRCPPLFGHQ